jgi:hypothetical protein
MVSGGHAWVKMSTFEEAPRLTKKSAHLFRSQMFFFLFHKLNIFKLQKKHIENQRNRIATFKFTYKFNKRELKNIYSHRKTNQQHFRLSWSK